MGDSDQATRRADPVTVHSPAHARLGGDLEPFDFGRLAERPHDALRGLSRESHVHHRPQLVGREAVREHDWLLTACRAATGEQRECAALILL
jgi:hypothetical protein